MPVATFHDLAAELCAAAGVVTPPLMPSADGAVAFTLHTQGVEIALSHDPRHPGYAFALIAFGQPPQYREAEVYRELLEANLMMLGADAPAFSLNAVDGRVILQYPWPLAQASGDVLWVGLSAVVGRALAWREDFRLQAGE